jgi:hypothetical protein
MDADFEDLFQHLAGLVSVGFWLQRKETVDGQCSFASLRVQMMLEAERYEARGNSMDRL